MAHFLLGVSFGFFSVLWWRESSHIEANPKKQLIWIGGMILSILVAWFL